MLVTWFLGVLADACAQTERIADGLEAVAELRTVIDRTGERSWEAEAHRLQGVLCLQSPVPDLPRAESCFREALDIARNQQAKSWELRVATSLARLWQSQNKSQDAHDLLAPVYGWFTEGFDTADLREAKALLDELA
jgi:predicted ATPase